VKSVSNWISYLHANFWIFSPPLAILFNFLNSKIDLEFPNFLFHFHHESGEAPMVKVVHLFKTCWPIFLLEFFEPWKLVFGANQLELEFNSVSIKISVGARVQPRCHRASPAPPRCVHQSCPSSPSLPLVYKSQVSPSISIFPHARSSHTALFFLRVRRRRRAPLPFIFFRNSYPSLDLILSYCLLCRFPLPPLAGAPPPPHIRYRRREPCRRRRSLVSPAPPSATR
jgi:hypothetical protein